MKKKFTFTPLFFIALFYFSTLGVTYGDSPISIPLRFHIITGLSMKKAGLTMESWVTQADIENTVMLEVNRIWRPANIAFVSESILHDAAVNPPDKAELIDYIVNARRNRLGKSDPQRIKKLTQLINWEPTKPTAINVYLVPYLGEKSQGNAKPKLKRIFIAQWSDKASKAKQAPEKFQLTEFLPYKQGSLSRTVAHELGHILGLKHPDTTTQTEFGLLMGGKKAGYTLTQQEIRIARKQAADLSR